MERITFEQLEPQSLPGLPPDVTAEYRRMVSAGQTLGYARTATNGDHATADFISASAETDLAIVDALAEEAFSQAAAAVFTSSEPPAQMPEGVVDQKSWAQGQNIVITEFLAEHAGGVAALCRGEGWKSYADPKVAEAGCSAPGVTTLVAVNQSTGTVAGFAQVLSDGIAQGYLAQLIIHPAYRRIGLARTLVTEVYPLSGAQRLDLLTDDAQAFYETFDGHSKPGYRIYPDR